MWLMFIINGSIYVAHCENPSRNAYLYAHMVFAKCEDIIKDRYGIKHAPTYTADVLDEQLAHWKTLKFDLL